MSVNITYFETSNETKWKSIIKNGDFAVIEGTPEHPIPEGLYRVFLLPREQDLDLVPNVPNVQQYNYLLLPMFDGPFLDNMFPYMIDAEGVLPPIKQIVTKILIEAQVS